jgi:hypothetical protein
MRTEVPGGCICWAGVWAFDADGPGGTYGLSSLVATSELSLVNAGDALDTVAGISREEVAGPAAMVFMPLVYKNWGGTEHKWSSLLVDVNVGLPAPVVFEFWSNDTVRGEARSCRQGCVITRYAQPGGMVMLNLDDETDPDIAMLPNGTFTVMVTGGGGHPNQGGTLAYWVQQPLPGGHVLRALHVTATGKMATSTSGNLQQLGESAAGSRSPWVDNAGESYGPVLFKNYNGWNSGIVVSGTMTSGSRSTDVSISFFTEGGDFVGSLNDRVSRTSNMMIYLPAVQFIPDGYRGFARIHATAGGSSDFPGILGIGISAWANHVHYERNHAMAYDFIGRASADLRTDAVGELPCVSAGFTSCAWVADMEKTVASTEEGNAGRNTGIRLLNVDPNLTGAPARVTVIYIDRSGVIWADANEQFTIAPNQTVTVFPLYNNRLPGVFRGTARIISVGNNVVGIANTVDYSVMGRDASGGYNLQYHNGRTR